jgi:hypothetical protein
MRASHRSVADINVCGGGRWRTKALAADAGDIRLVGLARAFGAVPLMPSP